MKKIIVKAVSLFSAMLLAVSAVIFTPVGVNAAKYDSNTDFIVGKYGVFLHYLSERMGGSNMNSWNKAVNSFDTDKFAADMNGIGASWVTITLTQSSGYYCIPMPEMEAATGVKCGSERDLAADLIESLSKYGIKVMLYWNPGLPTNNTALAKALGAEFRQNGGDVSIGQAAGGDWMITYTAAKNVCKYVSAVSQRYGDNVVGWWFDGCYNNIGFNERVAQLYADAVRSGNKNTLIAFNQGTRFGDCRFDCENYSCGETCHPNRISEGDVFTDYSTDSRWTENGYQKHYLTFLGENWGLPGVLYDTDELVKHSYEKILKNGGAISFDVALSPDGTVNAEHLAQLAALNAYVSKQPEIEVEAAPDISEIPNAGKNEADNSTDIVDVNNEEVEKITEKVNYNVWLFIGLGAEICLGVAVAIIFAVRRKEQRK